MSETGWRRVQASQQCHSWPRHCVYEGQTRGPDWIRPS